jgi:hypothetical protein
VFDRLSLFGTVTDPNDLLLLLFVLVCNGQRPVSVSFSFLRLIDPIFFMICNIFIDWSNWRSCGVTAGVTASAARANPSRLTAQA